MLRTRPHHMPLGRLLPGHDAGSLSSVEITDVVLDSRAMIPGALFLACAGTRGHGLDHLEHAVAGGAAAVAYEPGPGVVAPSLSLPVIAVERLAERVGEIAAAFYGHPSKDLFVTGITGTDGKTSCAWLLAQALQRAGQRCGYLGTLGFGDPAELSLATHTTPDATRIQHWLARMAGADYSAAAMEVSSHALAQRRADAVDFDVAVLTQIGRDHLDYHGSEAAYVAAKRRLFEHPGLRYVVLNADDVHGARWLDDAARRACPNGPVPIGYGRTPRVSELDHHVHIKAIDAHGDGLSIDLATHLGTTRIDTALIGVFHAHNLAACLAVLLARGLSLADGVAALNGVHTVPGRMQRVDPGSARHPLVLVDYAHTPGALAAALASVRAHGKGRVYCVFGCGGDRDRGKRALMGAAAAKDADYVWLTDDNPRSEDPAAIVADIVAGLPADWTSPERYVIEHRRRVAIARAIAAAGPDDVVLIAGKGHETTQQYGSHIYDFDDRVVAARALEAA